MRSRTFVTFTSSFIQGEKLRKMVKQLLDWETFLGSALTLNSHQTIDLLGLMVKTKLGDDTRAVLFYECYFILIMTALQDDVLDQ